jgi:hypothetical protein
MYIIMLGKEPFVKENGSTVLIENENGVSLPI